MSYQREKWQAHMNRVGASALRNETAEMSQYFSQFGGVNVGSDFKTVDPECYGPGGAPGCDFGGMDKKDFYEGGRKAYRLAASIPSQARQGWALKGWQGKAWRKGWKAAEATERGPVNLDEEDLHQKTVKTYSIKGKKVRVVLNWRGNTPSLDPDRFYDIVDSSGHTLNQGEPWHDNDEGPPTHSDIGWLVKQGTFGARQKGVGRWAVEDDRKWGGGISWDSPRVNRGWGSVNYTIEHDADNNSFHVYRDHVFLGESESLGEAKAKAKRDLNYRTPEFGMTKIPAGIQLPPSWGVPDASMVKRGETPEGWDPNLFSQFGGASRKDFFNKGYRTMKAVITARQNGRTVGHPMNPYHGGGWQEAAFDAGVEYAKTEFRALRLSK